MPFMLLPDTSVSSAVPPDSDDSLSFQFDSVFSLLTSQLLTASFFDCNERKESEIRIFVVPSLLKTFFSCSVVIFCELHLWFWKFMILFLKD